MKFRDRISAALDYTQLAETVLRHRGMRHGEAREIIKQMASELFELRHRWEAIEHDYLERQKAKRGGDET
jgi:hypothetical protein